MLIFHIDANSAYLSWTAAALLEKGSPVDIREIPSAIAGNSQKRRGIILAKSNAAKACGVRTGDSIFEAKQKCPQLTLYPPDYDQFLLCSDRMYEILSSYTPIIQRYSIDECFLDCTNSRAIRQDPMETAYEIKERIKRELGFTVNIGIGKNKLMAKMAGELKKPDQVHTVWPEELEEKLWPLAVDKLFMMGKATARKLNKINIYTIGDLANANPQMLKTILKSHGKLVHEYANGIDHSSVIITDDLVQKGISNSTTMAFDAETREEIFQEALALCERVGIRLRKRRKRASLVRVWLKNSYFIRYRHQVQLPGSLSSTWELYETVKQLIKQCWKGEPVRQMGIAVSGLIREEEEQMSFFDPKDQKKQEQLEAEVDQIRRRFGERSIIRATFANSAIDPIQGGVNDGNYLMMGGFSQ